jgi:hypothetical protein
MADIENFYDNLIILTCTAAALKNLLKPNYFKKQRFSSSSLPEVDILVQNGHGVLSRLIPCILD